MRKELALQSTAGPTKVLVQIAFDGGGADQAYDVWPAPDGGYVLVGSTQGAGPHDIDALVMKLDAEGELSWAKKFGGAALDIAFAVRTLSDGTIAVAGWTRSLGAGAGDFYVLGLDDGGAVKFEKTFGGAGEERGTALTATEDGGAAIVGETYSHGAGDSRFYLVKIDADGELVWERTYDGGTLHERGLAIVADEDGYLLIGNAMDSTSGSSATISDGYAVRTDMNGEEVWSRRYGEDAHDIFHHGARLGADRYVLTGYTQGYEAKGLNDIWIVTVDRNGEPLRQQLFGGDSADHNIVARTAADGPVYLSGYSQSDGAGGWDAQVLKLSSAGEVMWEQKFGGPHNDGANAAHPLGEGRVAVAGYTHNENAGNADILFMLIQEPGE